MRSPRPARKPRKPRSPRSRPAPEFADAPLPKNRSAVDLVMIANGTLPWPPDLTDADERTIAQVRAANAQRDRLNRAAGKGLR